MDVVFKSGEAPRAALRADLLPRLKSELARCPRGSAAERWAAQVVQGCFAVNDPKTLDAWAKLTGISYSSLRESCYLLGIHPHDARDFTRVLRAVLLSIEEDGWEPARFLDVADRRTASNLLQKSGLRFPRADQPVLEQFLEQQSFVPRNNAGFRHVMALLERSADSR